MQRQVMIYCRYQNPIFYSNKLLNFINLSHAILARNNAAQLISRDWDFAKLKGITKVKLPEDIR